MTDDEQDKLIATGLVVSEEFGGADPSYMAAESLYLERVEGGKFLLRVTLIKIITNEAGEKIIAARRGAKND